MFDAGSHLHLALGQRSWLLDHLDAILATVARPDHREDDPRTGRERFYRRHLLEPNRWLRVVVDFNDVPGWVVTALVQDDDPRRGPALSVRIADITFEQHHYDERGDVLYLSVASYEGAPTTAFSTPEGHNVEYDDGGRVVGMTLTNVRWLLNRDGDITITWPAGHVTAEALAPALRSAA